MSVFSPILACLLAAAPTADAPPPGEHLATAKVCFDSADYACAAAALAEARARISALDAGDKVATYELSALTALSLDMAGRAEGHIKALLKLVPNFEPKGWREDWLAVLSRVRASIPDTTGPVVIVQTPVAVREREAAMFVVQTRDASGVDRVRLGIKTSGAPLFFAAQTKDRRVWSVALPPEEVRGARLAVWVQVWDIHGNRSSWGSADTPVELTVNRGPARHAASAVATPVHERWWFWTIIAVGVAGLATALAVTLAPSDREIIVEPKVPGGNGVTAPNR